jgi:nitrous oxidase accessory protein NosD
VAIGANNVWVHHNVIDSNSGNGVMPYSNASWNKITDNRIVGNGFRGVYINDLSSGSPDNNLVARNAILGNSLGAVLDTGTGNRIGAFVGGDASITGSNPWSNVVY